MKKNLIFLVMFVFLLFIPDDVLAVTDVEFKCFDEVMIGNSVECKISLIEPERVIKGIQLNYLYDKDFSYVKTISDSNWSSVSANNQGFVFINLDGVDKSSAIAQVDFLVSNNAIVQKEYEFSLSDIMLSDGKEDIKIPSKSFKVKVLSIHDILESISINNKSLDLKDGITDYKVNIPFDLSEVVVEANLKSDKYSYIDGYEPKVVNNLKFGENNLKIKIGIEGRELITFNLILNRLNNEDSNVGNVEVDNSKTGIYSLIVIFILVIVSIISVFFYKTRIKKVENK